MTHFQKLAGAVAAVAVDVAARADQAAGQARRTAGTVAEAAHTTTQQVDHSRTATTALAGMAGGLQQLIGRYRC
jgi:methyl-accepting chemotaxis protein